MRNQAVMMIGLAALAGLFLAGRASAQSDRAKRQQPFGGSPLNWSVEPIIDVYVNGMTRHYDLNKAQEDYTRKLMTRRVKKFLNEYEADVRSLFGEYYYYQLNKEVPTPDAAKDWARRCGPLATAIRKEIFEGNDEWRRVLNDDQKRKHDKDLEAMRQQFDAFDQQIDRWSKGDVRPSDIGSRTSKQPYRPRKVEDAWSYRVASFVQAYRLDEGQRQTAYSILRELEDAAARHRDKHKDELAQLDAQYKEILAASPKKDEEQLEATRQKLRELKDRRDKVEEYIRVDLWNQLLKRLDSIPNSDQRRAYDARMGKLDVAARGTETKTVEVTTTRPAATATQPVKDVAEPPASKPAADAVSAKAE